MNYVTLYEMKRYLGIDQSNTNDDEILNDWILSSSELIDIWRGREFGVKLATYLMDTPVNRGAGIGDYYTFEQSPVEQLFVGRELYLKVEHLDLLEVIQLINGDGVEITTDDYILEPYSMVKKNRIMLKERSSLNWLPDTDGNYRQAISLKGYFGFNKKYPKCFVDIGEVYNPAIGVGDTSITLTSVLGMASDLIAPRVSAGHMLRITSTAGKEFVYVTDANTSTNVVTFVRAYNGTTALAHPLEDKTIEVYRPDRDIVQIVKRLTQWRYRQKDQDSFDKVYNLAANTLTIPTGIPADIRAILGMRRPVL